VTNILAIRERAGGSAAGSKAFYSALTDRVTLPPPKFFTSPEEYYASAFHELIHYADFWIMPRFAELGL